MNVKYDLYIQAACRRFRLPFENIKALMMALSDLNPEFCYQTETTKIVGIFPVPENEAADWGCLPGDLLKPERSINAGCARFRALLDELYLIQASHRFMAAADNYVRFWDKELEYRHKIFKCYRKIKEYDRK